MAGGVFCCPNVGETTLDLPLLMERGVRMDMPDEELLHWHELVQDMADEQAELDQWEDEE